MLPRLAAFWFGIQVVWTAVLGLVLQDRVVLLFPGSPDGAVAAYALLAAAGAALAAAAQVAAGFASDRVRARIGGRRAFFRAGVALALPALVGVTAAGSLPLLWCSVLLLQLGMNIAGGPYQAVVTDHVAPERFGRASSWMSTTQFAGSVTGLLLATTLHGAVLGIALGACLVLSLAVTDRAIAGLPQNAARPERLRFDADARTVLASRALINVGFYTLFGFLFFFVRESLGVADARTTTGILFLCFTVAGIGGAALAGRAADRVDKRLVVTAACAAIGVAVTAFAFAPNVPAAVACALASGAAWGAFLTADWAIAYAVLPGAAMASAMGIWNLAAALPQIAAPIVTAPLVHAVDLQRAGFGPRVALLLVVAEFAAGTAWLWRVRASRLRAPA